MNKTQFMLEGYLTFIHEKEWNDINDPGSTNPHLVKQVVGDLHGSGDLAQQRQKHQPSMVSVYVKNALGDYRGRADSLNTFRFKRAGLKDWEMAKKILKKAIDHEKKLDPAKIIKKIMTVQNISKEPLGKEAGRRGATSHDSYTDGTSSGPQSMTGGPTGGMGGGGQ